MMAELLRDVKSEIQEMPGVAAAIVLAIAVGVGCNAAFFWQADGDALRVSASRGQSTADQVERLHAQRCSMEATPGFTVIVGLREYSVEVSVPVPSVHALFEDVHANVAAAWWEHRHEQVA
ncbi:MAG TPA: hypothetical protein VK578_00570 [Edaphobacter sp.]|jgi:hypothetical protein|nr:hypothetical protein [Edaphobacter sp.]